MKVTVTVFLNVRVGAASVNAPCYNYLAPGSVIEVEENTVPGDLYENNDQWYKGLDGCFYWSGGVSIPSVLDLNPVMPPVPAYSGSSNYAKSFRNIPANLLVTQGKNVTVAVMDTGIFQAHPDLANAFTAAYPAQNYTDSKVKDDIDGHGTHVAGLIGGRGVKDDSVTGIAPACTLQNIKVLRDDGSSVGAYVESGCTKLAPVTDIVNMSLSVTVDEYEHMITIINDLAKATVVICAAGEDDLLLSKKNSLLCPAYTQSVIAIGTVSSNFMKNNPAPVFHPHLDYILPELSLRSASTSKDGLYKERSGSSMAAGLLSGLAALIISANKGKVTINTAFVKSKLDELATKYSANADLNSLNLLKP